MRREKKAAMAVAVVWRLTAPKTDWRQARESVRPVSRAPAGIRSQ
jgi:hypothetical protein